MLCIRYIVSNVLGLSPRLKFPRWKFKYISKYFLQYRRILRLWIMYFCVLYFWVLGQVFTLSAIPFPHSLARSLTFLFLQVVIFSPHSSALIIYMMLWFRFSSSFFSSAATTRSVTQELKPWPAAYLHSLRSKIYCSSKTCRVQYTHLPFACPTRSIPREPFDRLHISLSAFRQTNSAKYYPVLRENHWESLQTLDLVC